MVEAGKEYGSRNPDHYFQGTVSRGKNLVDRRCDDCSWNHLRLLAMAGVVGGGGPWRYCHTVWLLQIPDRYHGGNHRHLSADRSGLAGTWNDAFKET